LICKFSCKSAQSSRINQQSFDLPTNRQHPSLFISREFEKWQLIGGGAIFYCGLQA